MSKEKHSIFRKILLLCWLSLIPILIIAAYSIAAINTLYRMYDRSVANITAVNRYNLQFEKDMNGTMYYLVVETYDWDQIKRTKDTNNPYAMIEDMRTAFRRLKEGNDDPNIINDIDAVQKMLDNLEDRVDDIIRNIEEGGHYDENMDLLHDNINVLTSLIQGDIEDYIYLEAANMEENRVAISKGVTRTIWLLGAALVALTAVILIASWNISRKVTEPIRSMRKMTERFANGDFSVRVRADSGDELEDLANSFNLTVAEISKLVDDITREQQNAKDMELKLLQAQINPHFLYNTLDAIMWLTEAGENAQAVSMLSSLSKFFRTTLSKGRDWIKVSEEESHIRSYLEIQQFRYQDILSYRIEIPEEMEDFYLMKLMLQPIVENALYHGIKNKRGMGTITVTGQMEGKDLIFTVEDDGIGMTEEELEHFEKLLSGEVEEDTQHGFGVANVEKRIRLNYGDGYGIKAKSIYGEGTQITVRIPALTEPREEG